MGGKEQNGRYIGKGQNDKQSRQNSLGSALIKLCNAETVTTNLLVYQGTNQIAGDDKENIHPDEAALHPFQPSMIKHHRYHRDGSQPVDIRAILNNPGQFIHLNNGVTWRLAWRLRRWSN